ncbi:succinyl-diaminopimelate desuccinylase [Lacimicrobium alkaliphilum]|uniref:Succinyl-diaminopimelate desuccinylase n=1 Tax=Lacimicrobium alkaliphilum TaxID=1526571 RepID=A0A0U3AMI2_9ALTE|nr:succinyl-diaminopimelate desuccinylase [Lacimicrobium alkaliphilum]ALS99186.1 succinyl-diaminopimelate desuccinylase [Lacimicrobium alkaliphilum]
MSAHRHPDSETFLSLEYSQNLMRRASVTPEDKGCQLWLAEKLSAMGFECEFIHQHGVSNLIASFGQGIKTMAFAGHTDVVPPGPPEKWHSHPFAANIVGDRLIGRGAADMKTGIGAMLAATERFLVQTPQPGYRLMWLITSDEEGEAEFGSRLIKAWLDERQTKLDYCVVGEPTARQFTGDTIKTGRRGAVSARLRVFGRQGHVAYPQFADNAIHKMNRVLSALNDIEWDQGSDDFPGTGLQVTHIDSGNFTDNIVPAQCDICFNLRYSHRFTQSELEALITQAVAMQTDDFELEWERPCAPYLTHPQKSDSLIGYAEQAIHKHTGAFPVLSTSGGTSDGRFFAGADTQVIELGVPNASIHQVNEWVRLKDLRLLEDIYTSLLSTIQDACC